MFESLESENTTSPDRDCGVLAPPARLELTTLRLGGARSIQVSYGGIYNYDIVPNYQGIVNLKYPGSTCVDTAGVVYQGVISMGVRV